MPKILMRRDTAATWAAVNPTLSSGEWALETDTGKMKLGDGQTAWNSLDYYTEEDKEWEKPADWPDIRSGALPNSVYCLVAHSEPVLSEGTYSVATFPQFYVSCAVNNSGSYDVYVDGIKAATTAGGTATTLDWATLYTNGTITGGHNVTYPSNLVTHVVRITPSVLTNHLNLLKFSTTPNTNRYGVLWAHFTTTYKMNLPHCFYNGGRHELLEAVTSVNGKLTGDWIEYAFAYCNIKTAPVIEATDNTSNISSNFLGCPNIKKIVYAPISTLSNIYAYDFSSMDGLEEIVETNGVPFSCKNTYSFRFCPKLKRIKATLNWEGATVIQNIFEQDTNMESSVLDVSAATGMTRFHTGGNSTYPLRWLKGLTVSSSAPFSASSPQIDVQYTGLDRSGLVTLFNSMPYNVAYTTEGNPTINNGVISGITSVNVVRTLQTIPANFTELEMVFKVIKNSNTSDMSVCCWGTRNELRRIYANGDRISLRALDNTEITAIEAADFDFASYVASGVYIRLKVENRTNDFLYTLSASTDKETWVSNSGTSTENICSNNVTWFLTSRSGTYDGEPQMNLNETYIKVNGVPFFGPGATKNLVPGGTLVGSPTITNGIASGFSTSKYIAINNYIPASHEFEYYTSFTVNTSDSTYGNSIVLWGTHGSDRAQLTLTSADNNAVIFYLGAQRYERNGITNLFTYKHLYFSVEGTTATLKLGVNVGEWDYTATFNNVSLGDSIPTEMSLGYVSGNKSNTAYKIDLNNTYLKSGSTYIYRGMVPQVKTCSVVGCTGTSALTAADKAIATDKGWSLTVS